MSRRVGLHFTLIALLIFSATLILPGTAVAQQEGGTVSVALSAGEYTVQETARGHRVLVDGFGSNLIPGKPNLPAKIFAVAIPYGAEVEEISFEYGAGTMLPGVYNIPPVALPRVIGKENSALYAQELQRFQANYDETYLSDNPYPTESGSFVGRAGYRKYNLVDVRFSPFTYQPESGKLTFHPSVTVHVQYSRPASIPFDSLQADYLPRTENVARSIIANYDQASSWYPRPTSTSGRGLHDFVIITTAAFEAAVQSLVDWETSKGRNVEVVLNTWIDANYSGYDQAEKTRNFLRDKYPSGEWGIEDVLLVGQGNDCPMRRCYQDLGYGEPETDFYFAELSKPDSTSWDSDGDHRWGEDSDSIDFYAEVNVGRIPWLAVATVEHICDKSVAFEMNTDPTFKKNMLLLGGYFWADTDNAELMEYKTRSDLHSWMADWTLHKMYEQNVDYYSTFPCDEELLRTNVISEWSSGKYAFVNWAGHGSPTSTHIAGLGAPAFITSSDCNQLNDNYPAIIFADACSNSDTDSANIGRAMLGRGAVGFLGATKVALGCPAWNHPNDGSSQSLDYYFTTSVTSENYTQGAAHQYALRKMYTDGLFGYLKYEFFEWGALWGNPNLGMGEVIPPALQLDFPQSLPEGAFPPGPATRMQVTITNGQETYVPGSGLLHYRFSPLDAYSTVGLTALVGNLYEAVLPNTRPGDKPEYYFTVEGSGGTTVASPFDAPASVHSFDVCFNSVMMEDNFQTDMGWSVVNVSVTTGAWERANPEATGAQPEDDHSAVGALCYVTQAAAGSSDGSYDLDGGPTRLLSPVIDLAGSDAVISFYYYFHHATNGTFEPLRLQITNNGSSWVLVEDFTNNPSWTEYSFKVSDVLTPTANVQLRFSAEDNPNDSLVEALIDDFTVEAYNYDASLWADAYAISAATGASIGISLDAGVTNAGRDYLILGSFSGTSPGTPLPGGLATLPINWDNLTDWILNHLGTGSCVGFYGPVELSGEATATFNTGGPLASKFIGRTMHFAYLLDGSPAFNFVSNAIAVTIEP